MGRRDVRTNAGNAQVDRIVLHFVYDIYVPGRPIQVRHYIFCNIIIGIMVVTINYVRRIDT